MFDYCSGVAEVPRRLANHEMPPQGVPVRPQGSIPVVARFVWSDGAEDWRPARAIRWTASHVMIVWLLDGADPRSERTAWLRAGDVARSVSWLVPPGRSAVAPPRG